jgi:predicted nucleic acid-binding protein
MTVYFDTCSLQRPLDDKSQLRIRLEAEAVLSVIDLVETGILVLISSDALTYETERNPHPTRRQFVWEVLADASEHVEFTDRVERRAHELNQTGIQTLDSLHLASAEDAKADVFCTCDDSFLNKAKQEVSGTMKVVSPLELAEELDRWQSQ